MSSSAASWFELSDGSRFELKGTIGIGRSADNAMVVDDEKVSRRHAIIQAQDNGEFWIVDLGSANGTFVNDRRIAQAVQLHANDVVHLSSVEMTFRREHLSAFHPGGKALMASTMLSVKTANCWMMMADIVGSTRLSQCVTEEELPRITGGWFKACREVVEAHDGHIMKYLGDGFFCYWEDRGDSAEKIRAAISSLAPMQQESPPFRMVLHYGKVAQGSVPTMAEMNLHGPEVNFAFRIEKIAGALQLKLMLSEAANQRLGLPTLLVHSCGVDGFQHTYNFYSNEQPKVG